MTDHKHDWGWIPSFITLSTAHIKWEDALAADDGNFPCVLAGEYSGWIFAVPDPTTPWDMPSITEYSPELCAILDAAAADGIHYVWFNPNSPTVPDFPTFRW